MSRHFYSVDSDGDDYREQEFEEYIEKNLEYSDNDSNNGCRLNYKPSYFKDNSYQNYNTFGDTFDNSFDFESDSSDESEEILLKRKDFETVTIPMDTPQNSPNDYNELFIDTLNVPNAPVKLKMPVLKRSRQVSWKEVPYFPDIPVGLSHGLSNGFNFPIELSPKFVNQISNLPIATQMTRYVENLEKRLEEYQSNVQELEVENAYLKKKIEEFKTVQKNIPAPKSAYKFFEDEQKELLKKNEPFASYDKRMEYINRVWNDKSDDEKDRYIIMSKIARDNFVKEVAKNLKN